MATTSDRELKRRFQDLQDRLAKAKTYVRHDTDDQDASDLIDELLNIETPVEPPHKKH